MAITTTERTQIIELTVLMFDAAPSANYLSEIVSVFEANGHNLQALARTLGSTGAYLSLNTNFQTAADFATKLLAPLKLDADAFARDFVISRFNSGVSKADISFAVFNALNNDVTTSSPAQYQAAKAILMNEVDVATYYAVTKGITGTDLSALQHVLDPVTADPASVTTAKAAIDQPVQTFNIVTDTASVNEGSTMLFTLTTTGVPAGSTYAYTISGVSAADVVGGSLTGTATIGTDGKAVVAVNLAADKLTEGAESMTFAIAGKSTTVTVNDTSTTPAPGYSAPVTTATAVNEGQSVTFYVDTQNVAAGSTIEYTLSGTGINSTDLNNIPLSGHATVDAFGRASVTVTTTADLTTEGAETLTFTYTDPITSIAKSVSTTINDTSLTPNQNLTLTSGTDSGTSFVGGAGNDTFNGMATANSLNTSDVLSGAAGTDTVTALLTGLQTVRPTLSGIEVVSVQATGGAVTVDLSSSTGVTTVENVQSTSALTFTNADANVSTLNLRLAPGSVTSVQYTDTALTGSTNVLNAKVDSSDAATINVDNSTAGGTQKMETLNVEIQTNNDATPTLTIGGNALSKVVFTSDLASNGTDNAAYTINSGIASIDASAIIGAVTINSGAVATSQTIATGAGADVITGGTAADVISTGAGNDTITGGAGADNINAGAGNDTLNYASTAELAGDASVDGGAGTDTIVLALAGDTLTDAQLAKVTGVEAVTMAAGGVITVTLGANATAGGLTTVTTGAGNDVINTSAAAYTLNAVINAGAGDDAVTTGTGNDTITIGAGNDNVNAGAGNDTIVGGANVDAVDVIVGGTGTDTLTLSGGALAGVANGGAYAAAVTLTNVSGVETITVGAGLAAVDNVAPTADVAGSTNDYSLNLVAGNVTAGNTLTIDASALRAGIVTTLGAGGQVDGAGFVTSDENLTLNGAAVAGNLNVIGGAAADAITGGTGNDTVNAGAGNDVIVGGAGANVLNGEAGNDNITGGAGADTIDGGAGTDTIVGTLGADSLSGGDGNDVFQYAAVATLTANAMVDGGAGTDSITLTADALTVVDANLANVRNVETLTTQNGANFVTLGANAVTAGMTNVTGGTGADTVDTSAAAYTLNAVINAGAGNDTVTTGAGNDTITIGAGSDTVNTGAGNDTIVGGADVDAADAINGGTGADTLTLNGNYAGLVLGATTVTNVETISLDGVAVEAVAGTPGTVAVTQSYNITTNDGNIAAGQTLTVDATDLRSVATGAGVDLAVGTADDVFSAGTLTFSAAAELDGMVSVTGGAGADNITGGALADTIDGAAGNDVINGGNGANVLLGGAGNDAITAGTGADSIDGGVGNDTITGGSGRDTLLGGDGDDVFVMTGAEFGNDADSVDGGAGADAVQIALAGAISVPDVGFNGRFANVESLQFSGAGTATMNMGFYSQTANVTSVSSVSATALLNVDATNYTIGLSITGNAGNDTITGGSGNDTLNGAAGNDALVGGGGNDLITIGAGTDTVDGGTGNDTIVGGADMDAADVINGGAGTDQLNLNATYAGLTLTNVTNVETLSLDGVATEQVNGVIGAGGAVGAVQSYVITTVDANVAAAATMTVDASDLRVVTTGAGADNTVGTADDITSVGTLTFNGGAELDGAFNVTGGAGNDTITTGAGNDVIAGGAGNDTIVAGNGTNTVTGGAGDDALTGGTGVDNLDGGAGNDALIGGGGNDVLTAGEGSDTITGGTGADTITLTESVAARDTLNVANLESARLTADTVTGFGVDTDAVAGLNATADVIDFGSAILVATGVTTGVVGGTLQSSMSVATSFLAAVQLLENELHNQGGDQTGTVAFQFGGSTYVGEVTVSGAGANDELVTDVVQLVGVTGVTQLIVAGGTAVGLSV